MQIDLKKYRFSAENSFPEMEIFKIAKINKNTIGIKICWVYADGGSQACFLCSIMQINVVLIVSIVCQCWISSIF